MKAAVRVRLAVIVRNPTNPAGIRVSVLNALAGHGSLTQTPVVAVGPWSSGHVRVSGEVLLGPPNQPDRPTSNAVQRPNEIAASLLAAISSFGQVVSHEISVT